ncbi:MAG: DUF2252 family protein [Anaerolineae bacterium]|nr:DUF2252 family protein [Anaerolineae bacterium]
MSKKESKKQATANPKQPQAAPVATIPQTHTLSLAERRSLGKQARQQTPRNAHAAWTPPPDRADPIDLLIANSEGRVPELVPIRYGRMLASPFAFYRGAAAIMAYDLAQTPNSGINVQACGDCHLLNFGGFATPERNILFDINDFDETSVAPWEWDVKRLAASFVIAGRANGFKASDCRGAARLAAETYRERIAEISEMPTLTAWYEAIDLDKVLDTSPDRENARFYRKKLAAAMDQSAREKEFAKLAHEGGYPARIIDQPPLIYHYGDMRDAEFRAGLESAYETYKASLSPELHILLDRYQLDDAAFKAVGVGSVGTFCGIVLLMSGSDALFLQFKEAKQSVLEPYAGPSPYAHPGQRVVAGQRLMQAASDMFLGWTTGKRLRESPFYLRQLRDAKIKPVIEIMKPFNLHNYARLCGAALARAHARSGDAVVLSSYMGKSGAFAEAIADFSVAYADQNQRDYDALVTAVRDGRIQAQMVE